MGFSENNKGVPYFGVLIIRILLLRVLQLGSPFFGNGPLFSETPIWFRELKASGCEVLQEKL